MSGRARMPLALALLLLPLIGARRLRRLGKGLSRALCALLLLLSMATMALSGCIAHSKSPNGYKLHVHHHGDQWQCAALHGCGADTELACARSGPAALPEVHGNSEQRMSVTPAASHIFVPVAKFDHLRKLSRIDLSSD